MADDYLTGIRVRLDSTGTTVSINRLHDTQAILLHRYIAVSFWPLALGFASTVHSVQGATISTKLCIDIQSCFAPGLAYTALSRNTNANDICLMRPLKLHDVRVLDLPAFYTARANQEQPQRLPRM